MFWRMIISVPFFWCAMAQALPSGSFPPPGMTLPEYWGEEHVWWDGRASVQAGYRSCLYAGYGGCLAGN